MASMLALTNCLLLSTWNKRAVETLSCKQHGKATEVARLASSDIILQRRQKRKQEFWPISFCSLGDELTGLREEGSIDQALALLSKMDQQGIIPPMNVYTFLLKACTKRKALSQAKLVQAHLTKHGVEKNKFISESVLWFQVLHLQETAGRR